MAATKSVEQVKQWVKDTIESTDGLTTEYYEIVDGITMQPITEWNRSACPIGCVTVYCGDVRLIDNIKYFK